MTLDFRKSSGFRLRYLSRRAGFEQVVLAAEIKPMLARVPSATASVSTIAAMKYTEGLDEYTSVQVISLLVQIPRKVRH